MRTSPRRTKADFRLSMENGFSSGKFLLSYKQKPCALKRCESSKYLPNCRQVIHQCHLFLIWSLDAYLVILFTTKIWTAKESGRISELVNFSNVQVWLSDMLNRRARKICIMSIYKIKIGSIRKFQVQHFFDCNPMYCSDYEGLTRSGEMTRELPVYCLFVGRSLDLYHRYCGKLRKTAKDHHFKFHRSWSMWLIGFLEPMRCRDFYSITLQ